MVNHLQRHIGPADDLVIVLHRKRADLSRAMALSAVFLQNANDSITERNIGCRRRRGPRQCNQAADGCGSAPGDILPGKQLLDRVTKIVLPLRRVS